MKIRDLKAADRIGWISMRAKLWPDTAVDELIKGTYVITDEKNTKDSKEQRKVFILENDDGGLCGFLEAFILELCKENGKSTAGVIEGIYVEYRFRKNDWGRKLIQEFEQWAKEEGCNEMSATAYTYRKAGIGFYTSMGYEIVFKDDKIVKFRKNE